MKLILVFLILLILPVTASSLGWFNISRATIQQLDADSYRLRVEVNFGGENFFNGFEGATGSFNHFSLGLLGTTQYHQTLNASHFTGAFSTPGEWSAGALDGAPMEFFSNEFGYDFDIVQPISGPFDLAYVANFNNTATVGELTDLSTDVTFSGNAAVGDIPESRTLYLFGLGLFGLGFWVYTKRMG